MLRWDLQWLLNYNCFRLAVTVMVMEEAGNQEATWNVPVVGPTETRMMVTVRYTSMSVMTTHHCGTKKRCANIQPNHIFG